MAKLGPLPDVPAGVKVRLIGNTPAGTPWVNVLHAKITGGMTTSTLNTVATSIRTNWTTNLAPACAIGTTLTTVEVTDISTRVGNQGVDQVGSAGTLSGAAMPANCSVCLTLKIPNRYRGGHPRLYMPGVGAAASTNGRTLTSAYQTNYTTWGRAFLASFNAMTTGTTTWQLAAVSYYKSVGGVPSYKTPPELYVVSDIICHGRLDSMRRRLGKETS